MKFIARIATLACSALLALGVAAQSTYPNKPVKLVVPLPAGGQLDGLARMLQPHLAEILGQPIVVENVSGAAARIGTAQVVRAAADGYTLLMVYDTLATDPILYKKTLPYDPLKNLAPVSLITRAPQVAIASTGFAPASVAELVAYAKKNPGKVNFGSPGTGSSSHLAAALFARTTDTQMTHIPYNGGAPLTNALYGGHVDIAFVSTGFASQVMKSGKVRLLGMAGATRHRAFPELKTLAEQGVPNVEVYGYFGLMAPAGTPEAIVRRWNEALHEIARRPDSQAWFAQSGLDPVVSSPREFGEFLRAENLKWAKIIKDENIPTE